MQWSSKESRTILTKEVAEESVLEFVPMRFDLGSPPQALNYLTEKRKGSDFRMNDAIRIQTGIDEVEKISEEKKVEAAALEKLKDVQEMAYQEAYQLGLDEGRKKAFEEVSEEIKEKLDSLEHLLGTMKSLKKDMSAFNESSLVQLMFHMAARLAKTSLAEKNDGMVDILREAVALAQEEESITVKVAPEQYDFLETLKQETGRDFEFVKKLKLEQNAEITPGGCIVETNYGEIDARYEQRVEQLWNMLREGLPKVKDRIAG